MKKIILVSTCLAAVLFSMSSAALPPTDADKNLTVVTWNLEHLMSKKAFNEREIFCSKVGWQDPKGDMLQRYGPRPTTMNYCDALNGMHFFSKKRESLPLQSWEAYQKKVNALKDREKNIGADIYALQEVRSKAAVHTVFDPSIFEIYATELAISLNLAFAVRKSFLSRQDVSLLNTTTIKKLSIKGEEGYRIRPGQELNLLVNGLTIVFLNVHLKSGCRNDPLDKPNLKKQWSDERKKRKSKACKILRRQVPILEEWLEYHASENVIVLGDFNRNLSNDRRIGDRLDGSKPSAKITAQSKLGGLFFEIGDGEPASTVLHNFQSRDDTPEAKKCISGVDHIIFNQNMSDLTGMTYKNTKAIKYSYSKSDYGKERAKPSDHCPISLNIKLPD